jgi:hypothetical protein
VFNVNRHAYKHSISNRALNQKTTTWPVSSTTYSDHLETLSGDPNYTRPSLTLTPQEAGEVGPGAIECIIVGLVPPFASSSTISTLKQGTKKKSLGCSRSNTYYEQGEGDEVASRALARITDWEPAGIKLFALVEERYGLCVPYLVAQIEVFYFLEFRGKETSTNARESVWIELIRKHCVRACGIFSPEWSRGLILNIQTVLGHSELTFTQNRGQHAPAAPAAAPASSEDNIAKNLLFSAKDYVKTLDPALLNTMKCLIDEALSMASIPDQASDGSASQERKRVKIEGVDLEDFDVDVKDENED